MKTSRKSKRSAGLRPAVAEPALSAAGGSRPRTPFPGTSVAFGKTPRPFQMFLVPCSCGTTFAVAENYDRQGTAWSRYMVCPGCGKRHDPKNRLLQMGFHPEGYWKVDEC